MALWDQVEFGFSGDETCNFGPRVESGSALFQVDTTALICPSGEVTEEPQVHAASSGSELCVAADSHVSFFTDEGATYSGNLAFESHVDALSWCCEGILVVCERNGSVHFIDGTSPAPLFSQVFVPQTDPTCPTFISVSYSTSSNTKAGELLLLTRDRLFVLSDIQLAKFLSGVDRDIRSLQKEIKMTMVDVSSEHTEGATSARHVGNHGNLVITTGHGNSVLTLWSPASGKLEALRRMRPSVSDGIVKVGVLENGRFLLVLNEKGTLGLLHTNTLTYVYRWPSLNIRDFIFLDMETSNSARWPDVKLAVLMARDSAANSASLQICSLRSMKAEYTLHLDDFTHLVHGPPHQEDVFFVEGVTQNKGGVSMVTSLRLRGLAQVQPETRFNRMLHKKQFEKAEALAKDFNLDVELVYKVKANGLLDHLSPWCIDKLSEEEADQRTADLRACLERITDEVLIVECCIKATPHKMEHLYKLLLYAKQRLSRTIEGEDKASVKSNGVHNGGLHNGVHNGHGEGEIEKDDGPNVTQLNKILETFHRLDTFHMAFGPESYEPGRWADFRCVDLLDVMFHELEAANLSAAFTIWRRHLSEFSGALTKAEVEGLLVAIPDDVPAATLRPLLLKEFLPFIIRKLPDALSVVATWIRQKALNLEILEPAGWPMNGLRMAQLMDNCVEEMRATREATLITPGGSSSHAGHKHGESSDDALTQLQLLARELKDLHHLRTKYNCPLALAEYRKQTTESLIYRMLDQVPVVELVPSVISKVVIPYMKERKLKGDKMLLQYVVDIGERQGRTHSGPGATSWEEKALAVIQCISETEYKVKAVLAVVQRAGIPWSPLVEQLVADTLKLQHPLLEELLEQRRLVQLRKILLKYNQRSCILNARNTWKLINYIIRQNRETALEDALALVGNSEFVTTNELTVYKEQLDFFIFSNKSYEAIQLVKSLPAEKAARLGQQAVSSAIRELNCTFIPNKQVTYQRAIQVTHTMCDILRYLVNLDTENINSDIIEEFTDSLGTFRKIHSLQVEFGEFLAYRDYSSTSGCTPWTLLRQKVIMFFNKSLVEIPQPVVCDECNLKSSKRENWSLSKIYRFNPLLACYELTSGGCDSPVYAADNFGCLLKEQQLIITLSLGFSDLLGISRIELEREIVLQAAQVGKLKYAINMARCAHMQQPGEQTAGLLYQLVHQLVSIQANEAQEAIDACKAVPNLPAVVHQLACLAATHCSDDVLADCLELCKGCGLAESIANQCEMGDYESMLKVSETTKDPYENWTFGVHYKEEGMVLDSGVALPLINTYALSCVPEIGSIDSSRLPYIQNRLAGSTDTSDESLAMGTVESFSRTTVALVQHLEQNNHLLLALSCSTDALFVVAQNLSCNKEGPQRKEMLKRYIGTATVHLQSLKEKSILKIFKQPNCDLGLALGLLLNLPRSSSTKLILHSIKALGQNRYKLTSNVAMVGIDFSGFVGDLKLKTVLIDVHRKATWGHRLTKLGFTKEVKSLNFAGGPSAVLSQIVQHEAITLNLLQRFCITFELNENEALVKYLHYQLQPPVKPGQLRPPLQRAQTQRALEAIYEVSSPENLLAELNKIVKEVDPYDYERLQFIFDWIIQLDFSATSKQQRELLNHLLLYKRVAPPSEYETNYRTENEEDVVEASIRLSPLSKTRIPFHVLVVGRPMKIISPELSASTVEAWVPMAKLLNLQVDKLYVITIQNMVKQYVEHMKIVHPEDTTATGRTDFHQETSDSVTEMMATIRNMLLLLSNYETAMACASWTVKELPMGTVKVLALSVCVMLSQHWFESLSPGTEEYEKAKNINTKFEKTFKRLSTEQALHLHALGEPALLAMSSKPTALIKELYKHSSIQERTGHTSKLATLPNIHAAAANIAEVNNLELEVMQVSLLQQWLPTSRAGQDNMLALVVSVSGSSLPCHPSAKHALPKAPRNPCSPSPLTKSMTLDPDNLELTLGTEEEIDEDQVNLKRLVYMFQYRSLENSVDFLLNYIFAGSTNSVTMCQIRAMRCLFMITNHDIIEKSSITNVKKLEERLRSLMYLHELEQLNLGHTLNSFLKCNKDGLVKSIWRRHRHQKRAVKLVANLCLDYNLLDAPLWNSILKQLQAFGMLEHLNHVLVRLTEFPELWVIPSMTAMWKEVLSTPLTEVSAPLTPTQEEECLETLNLLHRCPCVLDLDLVEFASHFSRLELPLAALSCVLLLPLVADRVKHTDQILKPAGAANICKQLDAFQVAGRQLPLRDQIKTAVYGYVRRHSAYGELTETTYAAELAMILVREDDVSDLLIFLLRNNRLTEGHKLLMLLGQHHPTYAASISTVSEPEEQIRVYAYLYGIEKDVEAFLPEPTPVDA